MHEEIIHLKFAKRISGGGDNHVYAIEKGDVGKHSERAGPVRQTVPGLAHEAQVTLMKRSHGGDEADPVALVA